MRLFLTLVIFTWSTVGAETLPKTAENPCYRNILNVPREISPCSNQYWTCLYGRPFLTKCPEGLVFDNAECTYKISVRSCPEFKTYIEGLLDVETMCLRINNDYGDIEYESPCDGSKYRCKDYKPVWLNGPHDCTKVKEEIAKKKAALLKKNELV